MGWLNNILSGPQKQKTERLSSAPEKPASKPAAETKAARLNLFEDDAFEDVTRYGKHEVSAGRVVRNDGSLFAPKK